MRHRSMGSIGRTRFALGVRGWPAESLPLELIRGCDRLTHLMVE